MISHNAMKYLISKNYREEGPYTPAAIRKRIASGELDKGYYVLTEENAWVSLPEFLCFHPARSRKQAEFAAEGAARKRKTARTTKKKAGGKVSRAHASRQSGRTA